MRLVGNRKRRIIAALLVAGIAAASAIAASLSGSSTPSAGASVRHFNVARTANVPPPTSAQLDTLKQTALSIAASNGGNVPSTINVVPTTRQAANTADTGATVSSDQDVFMVTMTGNFTANFLSLPTSTSARPQGKEMTFTYDPSDGQILDLTIGQVTPNLAALGPVQSINP